jgi:antitoxin CptB
MLELDLLLAPFAKEVYPDLDATEQQAYRALLEQEDTDIFDWLVTRIPVTDPSLAAIVERIQGYGRPPPAGSHQTFA